MSRDELRQPARHAYLNGMIELKASADREFRAPSRSLTQRRR
jgi:hypothetical protein